MAKIKCSFCIETIEAPLWPEEKPPGWELMPDGMIVCPSPKHRGSFEAEMKVPTRRG